MKKNKIHKIQTFFIDCQPYEQDCCITINGSFLDIEKAIRLHKTAAAREILEHIKSNKDEYYEKETTLGSVYHKFPKGFAMRIMVQDNWIDTVKVVTHECFHLTSYVMRKVGITLTEESEEAYTYLQENLVGQILRKIY